MSKEKEREIIEIECPKCGCKQSYKNISKYSEGGECVSCGELTYFKNNAINTGMKYFSYKS